MQEDIRQVGLTVRDAMMYAADLKLGFNDLTREQKKEVVNEIIHLLRLDKTMDTDCSKLSGGELKRFSIAQELVNNPPILFLDEPTSGLDETNSFQCVELLKKLANDGRTIVCSIHTPSSKIFERFDHIYVVANGQCVYNGIGKYIVPYLDTVGLRCPKTYNPADFSTIMFICHPIFIIYYAF
jgi:ABC-type multidrug transport system ATPase subunit